MEHDSERVIALTKQRVEEYDRILHCARLCHNVIRALNDANDEITLSWEQSRDSTIEGVRAILRNPLTTPAESHQSWLDYKTEEGWKYGRIKDPVAQTHPCMVPYEELPPSQRVKDAIFGAIVRTFFGESPSSWRSP